MTITLDTLQDVLRTWALPTLKDAQKAFNKQPTALNWRLCQRAMMTYQQLDGACTSVRVDRNKLMFDLESNPLSVWPDAICRATLGLTCDQALNQTI